MCQLEQSIFTVTFTLQKAQGPVRVESYGLRGTIYAMSGEDTLDITRLSL